MDRCPTSYTPKTPVRAWGFRTSCPRAPCATAPGRSTSSGATARTTFLSARTLAPSSACSESLLEGPRCSVESRDIASRIGDRIGELDRAKALHRALVDGRDTVLDEPTKG